MIYIQTHTDFNISPIISNITDSNYQNFRIISTAKYDKLKNNYPFEIIYETELNNELYHKHDIYAEITYKNYIYKNPQIFDDDIIGFIQYKRSFSSYILNNYKAILNNHAAIVTGKYNYNMISQWNSCHQHNLLKNMFDLMCEHDTSYKELNIYNINYIRPHNIFIMKRNDFNEYCKFINWCIKIFNDKYGELNMPKVYSFLAERLTTVFIIKHFINQEIYDEWVPLQ